MAGLLFNGTTGKAVYPGLDLTGDYSILLWLRTTKANGQWQALISGETVASPAANSMRWSIERDNANLAHLARSDGTVLDAVWPTGHTWTSADGHTMILVTKVAGGGVPPRYHKLTLNNATGVWTLTDDDIPFDFQLANGSALGAGGVVVLGQFEGSDLFAGDMHMVAVWNNHIVTKAELATVMAAKTTAAVKALSPARLYDASDGLTNDLSGNAQHRTSTTGTSAATAPIGSAWSFGVSAAAPANTVAPAVTGTAQTGQTLTCSQGTWTNTPTGYTYQWKRNGVAIAGATTNTYVLQVADEGTAVKCTVTATNATGSTSADSNTVNPTAVPAAPVNTVAPAITGTATTGQVLSCSTGTWTGVPAPTFAYQWKRAGVAIAGAVAATYTLQVADEAQAVTCTVTATNASGSASATSNAVTPAAAGTATVPVRIAGVWVAKPRKSRVGGAWVP